MRFLKTTAPKVYTETFLLPKSLVWRHWFSNLTSSVIREHYAGCLGLIPTLFVDEGWRLHLYIGHCAFIKGHGAPLICLFCLLKSAVKVEGVGKIGSCCVAQANLLCILENLWIWCSGFMAFRFFLSCRVNPELFFPPLSMWYSERRTLLWSYPLCRVPWM